MQWMLSTENTVRIWPVIKLLTIYSPYLQMLWNLKKEIWYFLHKFLYSKIHRVIATDYNDWQQSATHTRVISVNLKFILSSNTDVILATYRKHCRGMVIHLNAIWNASWDRSFHGMPFHRQNTDMAAPRSVFWHVMPIFDHYRMLCHIPGAMWKVPKALM